jgi:hypothetical protein
MYPLSEVMERGYFPIENDKICGKIALSDIITRSMGCFWHMNVLNRTKK